MKKLLGVNIDHVATIRQARHTAYPDVVAAGLIAEKAGADSITVHLREDRRHIQPHDVVQLKQQLHIPLNLEMAASAEMVAFAKKIQPAYCCLVPEKRQELTTEGGLDVLKNQAVIHQAVTELQQAQIFVSLFIDPDFSQIDAAKQAGAPVIELHTGDYAQATAADDVLQQLTRLQTAAKYADDLGLQVNAGHGLHYQNTQAIAAIAAIKELNIGHAIVARALTVGLAQAVQEMIAIIAKH